MPINPMNFLDFHEIFVNELFGSLVLFIFVMAIIIFVVAMRFRIPFEVTTMLTILFILGVSYYYNFTLFIVLSFLFVGLIYGWMYARKLRNG